MCISIVPCVSLISDYGLEITDQLKVALSDRWATLRAEELTPVDYIDLTVELFGEVPVEQRPSALITSKIATDRAMYAGEIVWKRSVRVRTKPGDNSNSTNHDDDIDDNSTDDIDDLSEK